jgi:penicillin-binding protein 1A
MCLNTTKERGYERNDDGERPDNLSIKVDCWTPRKVETDSTAVPTEEEEQNIEDFEL